MSVRIVENKVKLNDYIAAESANIKSVEKSGPMTLINAKTITVWENDKQIYVVDASEASIVYYPNSLRTNVFILAISDATITLFDGAEQLHKVPLNSVSLLRSSGVMVDAAPQIGPIQWKIANGRFAIWGESIAYTGEISMPCLAGMTTKLGSDEPIPTDCYWCAACIKMVLHDPIDAKFDTLFNHK